MALHAAKSKELRLAYLNDEGESSAVILFTQLL